MLFNKHMDKYNKGKRSYVNLPKLKTDIINARGYIKRLKVLPNFFSPRPIQAGSANMDDAIEKHLLQLMSRIYLHLNCFHLLLKYLVLVPKHGIHCYFLNDVVKVLHPENLQFVDDL